MSAEDLGTLRQQVGEIIGTLREINHATNNNSAKIDGLTIAVATQAELIRRTTNLEQEQAAHHLRIAVLEADQHRREGAIGLVAWVSRHWPFTVVAVALGALIAWGNGKLAV